MSSNIYKIPEQTNDGWKSSCAIEENVDIKKIYRAIDCILEGTFKKIHSLLILKNGKLICEEYFPGKISPEESRTGDGIAFYGRDNLHMIRSATKSISSALIGIALHKNKRFNVNTKLHTFFPEYVDCFKESKRDITLKHLLTMTTGFPTESSHVYQDLITADDSIKAVLNRPVFNIGEKHMYSNCTANLLGMIIKRITLLDADKFAEKYLFGPIGIKNYIWRKNKDGGICTCAGLSLRSRDMAKIGYLFLNAGKWKERRIIPEQWINESTKEHVKVTRKGSQMYANSYGYQWWISPFKVNGCNIPSFSAQGHGGQLIFVFPSLNMVVVFTSGYDDYKNMDQPFQIVERYLIPAVLVSNNYNYGLRGEKSLFPEIIASREGNLGLLKNLKSKDVDINAITNIGYNALIYSALEGKEHIVKWLISNGANVNIKTNDGSTALHWAVYNGYFEVVKQLINAGCDIDVKNIYGDTALIIASKQNRLQIAQHLVNVGVEITSKNKEDSSALMNAVKAGNIEVAEILIDNGSYINEENEHGHTPLIAAASFGNVQMLRLLINKGAILEKKNKQRQSALMYAAKNGRLESVVYLLEKGANIEARDSKGNTILMLAIQYLEVVKYLVGAGIEQDAVNRDNYTALMIAMAREKWNVLKWLINNGANIHKKENRYILLEAVKRRKGELVRLLIEKGCDTFVKDGLGYTAEMWAEVLCDPEITRVMGLEGTKTKRNTVRKLHCDVLHFKCKNGFLEQNDNGYVLKGLGIDDVVCISGRKLRQSYSNKVIFTLNMRLTSKERGGNGFLIFSDYEFPKHFIRCGINSDRKCCIGDNERYFAEKDIAFEDKSAYELRVTFYCKTGKIKIVVDNKVTLETVLPWYMEIVSHAGYACENTNTYFDKFAVIYE